jgi:predicted CoA-binding protein
VAFSRMDLPRTGSPHRVSNPLATDEQIHNLLIDSSVWFVVGLGDNPGRPAYRVARFLQSIGKTIVPIHPRAQTVHGEQGFTSITDAARELGPPDVVDVFVRSDRAGEFADQAIAVDASAVWFQLGVIDDDAAKRVTEAGLLMVMDRCPAIEYPRLVHSGA